MQVPTKEEYPEKLADIIRDLSTESIPGNILEKVSNIIKDELTREKYYSQPQTLKTIFKELSDTAASLKSTSPKNAELITRINLAFIENELDKTSSDWNDQEAGINWNTTYYLCLNLKLLHNYPSIEKEQKEKYANLIIGSWRGCCHGMKKSPKVDYASLTKVKEFLMKCNEVWDCSKNFLIGDDLKEAEDTYTMLEEYFSKIEKLRCFIFEGKGEEDVKELDAAIVQASLKGTSIGKFLRTKVGLNKNRGEMDTNLALTNLTYEFLKNYPHSFIADIYNRIEIISRHFNINTRLFEDDCKQQTAIAFSRLGLHDAALELVNKTQRKQNKQNGYKEYVKGIIYLDNNNFDKAQAEFETSICIHKRKNKTINGVYFLYARALRYGGKYNKADEELKKLLKLEISLGKNTDKTVDEMGLLFLDLDKAHNGKYLPTLLDDYIKPKYKYDSHILYAAVSALEKQRPLISIDAELYDRTVKELSDNEGAKFRLISSYLKIIKHYFCSLFFTNHDEFIKQSGSLIGKIINKFDLINELLLSCRYFIDMKLREEAKKLIEHNLKDECINDINVWKTFASKRFEEILPKSYVEELKNDVEFLINSLRKKFKDKNWNFTFEFQNDVFVLKNKKEILMDVLSWCLDYDKGSLTDISKALLCSNISISIKDNVISIQHDFTTVTFDFDNEWITLLTQTINDLKQKLSTLQDFADCDVTCESNRTVLKIEICLKPSPFLITNSTLKDFEEYTKFYINEMERYSPAEVTAARRSFYQSGSGILVHIEPVSTKSNFQWVWVAYFTFLLSQEVQFTLKNLSKTKNGIHSIKNLVNAYNSADNEEKEKLKQEIQKLGKEVLDVTSIPLFPELFSIKSLIQDIISSYPREEQIKGIWRNSFLQVVSVKYIIREALRGLIDNAREASPPEKDIIINVNEEEKDEDVKDEEVKDKVNEGGNIRVTITNIKKDITQVQDHKSGVGLTNIKEMEHQFHLYKHSDSDQEDQYVCDLEIYNRPLS